MQCWPQKQVGNEVGTPRRTASDALECSGEYGDIAILARSSCDSAEHAKSTRAKVHPLLAFVVVGLVVGVLSPFFSQGDLVSLGTFDSHTRRVSRPVFEAQTQNCPPRGSVRPTSVSSGGQIPRRHLRKASESASACRADVR